MHIKWIKGFVLWGLGLVVLVYLLTALYLGLQVHQDTRKPSDAILVLGARVNLQNGINPCLKARVDHGVQLWKQKYAPVLIMSGGDDLEDGANEADAMQKLAINAGVPEQAILKERKAHSTYENLLFTQHIMQQKGLRTLLLVTEPFHMPRAALIARELGLNFVVSPAAGSPCWERWRFLSRYFLREPLGVVKNKLLGRW